MMIRSLSSSSWVRAGMAGVVAFFAMASCGGIQERLEVLRAERIEIVDDKGVMKMDLEKQIRALEERVQKLEGALERRGREEPAAAATATAAPSADAAATTPVASDAGSAATPRGADAGAGPRTHRPPVTPPGLATEIF